MILLNSIERACCKVFPISPVSPDDISSLAHCRPQTQGEEELQLQLALAMSREEADAEDSKKKSDDMRLQMAIAKSKEDGSEEVSVGNMIGQNLIFTTRRRFNLASFLSHEGMLHINRDPGLNTRVNK